MAAQPDALQDLIDDLVRHAHGNPAGVKEILAEHPQLVNAQARWGETPLQAAAQMGNIEITEYLLDRGALLDICTAAMLGLADTVHILLTDDPRLARATGAHGLPVLYFAVIHGGMQIAEMLRRHGAMVNAGEGAATPLHAAAMFNRPEMAAWLLKHGARRDAKDGNGKTALQIAEEKGHAAVAEILRRRGR